MHHKALIQLVLITYRCLTWKGDNCATYSFQRCKQKTSETSNQIFHVSKFTDDQDKDVFNWESADGRAMDAEACAGYKAGTKVQHCKTKNDLKQGKRFALLVTDVPLAVFTAHLDAGELVLDYYSWL